MKRTSKRLKIVEQIMIVLLLSVIIPLVISWLIINNISQQSVRKELKNTAIITATAISKSMQALSGVNENKLEEIGLGLKYIPTNKRQAYLNEIIYNNESCKGIKIIKQNDPEYSQINVRNFLYNSNTRYMTLNERLSDGSYLQAVFDVADYENDLFSVLKDDNRQVYILNADNDVILSYNYSEKDLKDTLSMLPKKIKTQEAIIFGENKNQPLVYYKLKQPDIMIIVDTTEEITEDTINKSRNRIIMAFLITGLTIILVVGLYTYYLYINIRQLIKGIIAISKGSYRRKIRLLKSLFTPYEIVFLSSEFNRMSDEIYKSYKQLKQKNHELKMLDEFRSNLIDTVSHEFRTPLTSIKGYTSRLLRTDIEIDEQTKNKSLKVIKRQVERLSTMVEDLLVIPDIEGANLHIEKEGIVISDVIETSVLSVSKYAESVFNINISQNISMAYADRNRLEQVLINVFENASKYAYENTNIDVDVTQDAYYIDIKVQNKADYIPKDKLNKLFEKFTRIDDKTTRTTSGTGLGLFIVKGLVNSMGGNVKLQSSKEHIFTITISLPIYHEELEGKEN